MRRKSPELTAVLNVKVPPDVRGAVEKLAFDQNLSLGEATRHFLVMGIKAAGVAAKGLTA